MAENETEREATTVLGAITYRLQAMEQGMRGVTQRTMFQTAMWGAALVLLAILAVNTTVWVVTQLLSSEIRNARELTAEIRGRMELIGQRLTGIEGEIKERVIFANEKFDAVERELKALREEMKSKR